MPTTTNFAFRYPDSTYAVNVPNDMANLASDIDSVLNTIHRPVGYSDIGTSGDVTYTGAAFLFPTFANTGAAGCSLSPSIMGTTFVAPRSGKVAVWVNVGQCRTNSAGGAAVFDYQIADGSTLGAGTVRRAAGAAPSANVVAVSTTSNENKTAHLFCPFTGLTPGNTYNITFMCSNTGGTTTFNRPALLVLPVA